MSWFQASALAAGPLVLPLLEFIVFVTSLHEIGLVSLLLMVVLPLSLAGVERSFHYASLVLVIAFLLCLPAKSRDCNVYLTLPPA